jgi:hypothetical protein
MGCPSAPRHADFGKLFLPFCHSQNRELWDIVNVENNIGYEYLKAACL